MIKHKKQSVVMMLVCFMVLTSGIPLAFSQSQTVYANSGTAQDIQAAIDEVMSLGGGKVVIPEGTFTFDGISQTYDGKSTYVLIDMNDFSGNIEVFGQGKDKTILKQTTATTPKRMFFVNGFNGGQVTFYGISFVGASASETDGKIGLHLYRCKDFVVQECSFEDFSEAAIVTSCYTGSPAYYGYNRGLITNCDIDQPYKDVSGGDWGYGIEVHAAGRREAWIEDIDTLLGEYDSLQWCVYIEYCTFSRTRHAIASNGLGWYVSRNNVFGEPRPENYGQIDVHGPLSDVGVGGRGLEAYNNIIYAASGYDYSMAMALRGGGGVVYDNTIIGCRFGVALSHDVFIAETEMYGINDMWIWDNNFQNVAVPIYDQYDAYEENVNYFLSEKNYVPYPSPHPLTLTSENIPDSTDTSPDDQQPTGDGWWPDLDEITNEIKYNLEQSPEGVILLFVIAFVTIAVLSTVFAMIVLKKKPTT